MRMKPMAMRIRKQNPSNPCGVINSCPEVIWTGHFTFEPQWHMSPHLHADYHELVLVLTGRLVTRIGGAQRTAGPGQAVFHQACVEHEEWAEGSAALQMMFVSWRQPADSLRPPPDGWLIQDRDGRIETALRWIDDLWSAKSGDADALVAAAGLLKGLVHAISKPPPSVDEFLITRVRQYVRERISQTLELEAMAAAVGMSRAHFTRSFRRAAGQSPMQFVRNLRVSTVRQLLNGPLTLDAIAAQVGLVDRFHLSRVYRRVTGRAPSQDRAVHFKADWSDGESNRVDNTTNISGFVKSGRNGGRNARGSLSSSA